MKEAMCPFDVIVITSPDLESSHAVRDLIKSSCGDFSSRIQDETLRNENAMRASDGTIFISSCDPYGARMGSGGGTIAAIAEADEVYSQLMAVSSPLCNGDGTTINEQYKEQVTGGPPTVLICHAGGESSRCPTQITLGKAWTSLPVIQRELSCRNGNVSKPGIVTKVSNPTALLISALSEIFVGVPKGSVVVAASDVLLSFQSSSTSKTIDFQNIAGDEEGLKKVFGLAVPAPLETAKNHGVFVLEKSPSTSESKNWGIQFTSKVLQKPSLNEMRAIKNPPCVFHHFAKTQENESDANNSEDFMAWIDTGVVTFLPHAAQVLRESARIQLRCCTSRGLEDMYSERNNFVELGNEKRQKVSHLESHDQTVSGQSLGKFAQTASLKIDLYSDMLQAMQTGSTSLNHFDSSLRRYLEKRGVDDASENKAQWQWLFSEFSKLKLFTCAIPTGSFFHLGTTWELTDFLTIGASHFEEVPETALRNDTSSHKQRMRSFGNSIGLVRRSGTFISGFPTETSRYSTALNSVLVSKSTGSAIGEGSVIEHSFMNCPNSKIEIGERCLLSGIRMNFNGCSSFHIPSGLCLQMLPLKKSNGNNDSYICICLGVDDPIKDVPVKTIFGMDFQCVLQRSGLTESDIWDEIIPSSRRMLWNAKIHPILHHSSSKGDGSQIDLTFLNWIHELYTQNDFGLKSSSGLKHWKSLRRLSISEIRENVDASAEALHRRSIPSGRFVESRLSEISEILMNRRHEPCNFDFVFDLVSSSSFENMSSISQPVVSQSLKTLDSVAFKAIEEKSYDIAGRVFMTMSLMLSDLAQLLPTIDCIDKKQSNTIELLKLSSDIKMESFDLGTMELIVSVRKKVLISYNAQSISCFCDVLEKASSAMTKRCISADKDFCLLHSYSDSKPTIVGETVLVSAPARIDLAGGWSDTPPLSYEFGGAVANLAVLVNGKRPLRAKCRLIKGGQGILLRTELRSPIDEQLLESTEVKISTLNDLADFHNPHSDCALLKSALVYLGLVSIDSISQDGSHYIQSYLKKFCRRENVDDLGLEIISCSLLPTGSGMGGSSILGGCVISAIAKCVGILLDCNGDFSNNIIHSVLMLEQLLTTGGGWQDQIGGLVGGLKLGTADVNAIPLQIRVKQFPLALETKRELNERLVLGFTGKPRLAKNILQNVLRRWARRTNDIMRTLEGLVKGAHDAIESLNGGDVDAIGTCMSEYWQHKKVMAGADSGVEPDSIKKLLAVLTENNVISGGTLCGAGGGGCLAMLAKKGKSADDVRAFVDKSVVKGILPSFHGFCWHSCEVAEDGIEIQII